jgi:hypothetical protein
MVFSSAQQTALDAIKKAFSAHRESGPKRHFPDYLRAEVVALVRGGLGVEAVARATGLSPSMIYRWRQPPIMTRSAKLVVPAPRVLPVMPEVRIHVPLRMVLGDFDVTVAVAEST